MKAVAGVLAETTKARVDSPKDLLADPEDIKNFLPLKFSVFKWRKKL